MYYLLLPSPEARTALIAWLRERGILAVFHYLPLHLSAMGRRYGGREGQCPVAEDVTDRLVRLPFYTDMSTAEQNEVIEGLVTGVNRGGLEVDLAGIRAFCPSSQIDARFPPTVSPKALVLTRQTFKITSIRSTGSNKGISMDGICESDEPGARGGSDFGTQTVSMVD